MVTKQEQLADFVENIFWDIFARIASNPLIIVNPNFFLKQMTEVDRRFFINCKTLRKFLIDVVQERKKMDLKEDDDDVDMISILVNDATYKDQEEDIVDDVLVMFLAGSKTI